ncbi:hypothetical protein [Longimicrobium sp.]|uniref:hypothetical protein n=1 Tax=Longimicrobium sp. TaxID=2029185 RepID=UPI002E303362|nr:hypothetical protein [Longimicrobium sp.]HEX6037915.1 hypothetical protein [Longimicrobium sp.]
MRTLITRLAPIVVLLLAACSPQASPMGPAPARSIDAIYAQAIANSAVYAPENVLPLFPVVPDADGNVRVVTLTTWNYAPGEQPLGRDIWVSVVPEARDSCNSWRNEQDLVMRLRQLFGLRPTDSVSHFVEMTVPATRMFRPTVDPAVTTRWPCGENQVGSGSCGLQFPAGVDPAHVEWMSRQMLSSWQLPNGYPAASRTGGGPGGSVGYPWTRLGYTYNWHPGSPRYGASEYLVRGGTQIRVDATYPIAAYCGRA